MEAAVSSLVTLIQRRRRLVLGIWLVVVALTAPLAARESSHLTGGGFNAPGSQSLAVQEQLQRFGSGATIDAVLVPRPGADVADVRRAIDSVAREARTIPRLRVDPALFAAAVARVAARPGRPVIVAMAVPSGNDRAIDVASTLRGRLGIDSTHPGRLAGGRVEVHLVGQGALWAAVQAATKSNAQKAEARALPLIALVLLIGFGSLAATVLPLGLGVASVVVSGGLIYLLSLQALTSVFVTNIASMLGLGVAVDYSLFVLIRYREELRAGAAPEDALRAAMTTSGVAVIFSAVTVMVSTAGLFIIDSTALRSIAAGAILVVAVAVLGAVTLLPALIALLGRRIESRPRRRPAARSSTFWPRWAAAVTRRPVLALVASGAVLVVLAIPALRLNIENPALEQVGAEDPFRTGAQVVAADQGAGAVGPVQIVVTPRAVAARASAAVAADPNIMRVMRPLPSSDGRSALLVATLRGDPTGEAARATIERLRRNLAGVADGALVGGTSAELLDFDQLVRDSMWKIALFVIVLSFVVLTVTLRSIVLPLKAVLLTMLSVLATYGVLVAAFQWGWGSSLGLADGSYIDTITPPLVLVIAFGLSMDYEIFLLSRIRERHLASGDLERAVAEGLSSTARTITTAAFIMVVVFLAFVSSGMPSVQRIGLGWAVAVALDATLVRLVLVPASMVLLKDWNWWLPAWLGRILPEPTSQPDRAAPPPVEAGDYVAAGE